MTNTMKARPPFYPNNLFYNTNLFCHDEQCLLFDTFQRRQMSPTQENILHRDSILTQRVAFELHQNFIYNPFI